MRKRDVPRSGMDVTIVVTGRGELLINGVDYTEEYKDRPVDQQLMNELEMRAKKGEFDHVRHGLLNFLRS